MRLFRSLLFTLLGLVLLGGAVAISPPFQEWAATRILAAHTGAEVVAAGSASVGLRSIAFENLRLKRGGAVLSLPTLTAAFPTTAALWSSTTTLESVTAKGWTLDISQPHGGPAGENETKPPHAATSQLLADPVAAIAWLKAAPIRGTWKSAEIEGDILLPGIEAGTSTAVHVKFKGGELAPGKSGEFAVDVSSEPVGTRPALRAQGRLRIGVAASGEITRLAFDGRAAPEGKRIPADLRVVAEISTAGSGRDETLGVKLLRGERSVIEIEAKATPASHRFQGTWVLQLQETDVGSLLAPTRIPIASAKGTGTFEAATDFRDIRVAGQLKASALPVALAVPNAGALRTVLFDGLFDVRRANGAIDVARFEGDLVGNTPMAHVRLLQPCRIGPHGEFTVSDRTSDWLEISATALPLAMFSRDTDRFRILEGTAAGTLTVRTGTTGLHAQTAALIIIKDVAMRTPDGTILRDVAATLGLTAELPKEKGWLVQAAPFSIQAAGRQLITLETEVRGTADAYGRFPAKGAYKLSLDAWKAWRGADVTQWLPGGELSGDFTGNIGAAADLTMQFTLTGKDSTRAIGGQFSAAIDDYTSFTVRAPLQLKLGGDAAELLVEGKWTVQPTAHRVGLQFSSKRISLAQLRSLSDLIPALAQRENHAGAPMAGEHAFWYPLTGWMRFECPIVTAPDVDWHDVSSTVRFEPAGLAVSGGRARHVPQPLKAARLKSGEIQTEPSSTITWDGTLAFDPQSAQPYQLKARTKIDVVPAWRLFGWSADRAEAVVDGHWSVSDAVTATGSSLAQALSRRQDEVHLESNGGTLRLLRVNISDAVPDEATPVSDTLATIGAAAGAIFGRRGNSIAGQRKLPATTEALLNFTHQAKEMGYDKIAVTANRDTDGTLQLKELVITTPNARLTGSGRILHAPAQPFSTRPLNLKLELAFRGIPAERLATGGLLESAKDADGFMKLKQSVLFGGTLQQIDNREWHDLLAKAAAPKPDAKK